MSVYARTEEGQWAAYNAQSALPRKLKSLLRVVDGKTSTDMYVNSLVAYGDVMGLLQSLEMAGLIKLVDQGLGRVKVNDLMPPQERERLKQSAKTDDAEWSDTRMNSRPTLPAASQPFGASTTPAANAGAWGFAQTTQHTVQQTHQNAQSVAAFTRAMDMMSLFVLTHLPGSSVAILTELEAKTSLEELAVTLGGYEQAVSQLGPVSVAHIKEIKALIRDNL